MPKVSIIKCSGYDPLIVGPAISRTFELLGIKDIIKPGQKVLLKPNLLMNAKPERGVTTHPSIVAAIANEVRKLGAEPYLGDSPGGVGRLYDSVLSATGMKEIGVPIVDFEGKGMRRVENRGGSVDPIYISNVVLGFDAIINIPKMKTHELTLITAGIKNIFGCVPGLLKVRYHLESPTPELFSLSLVELFEKIRPVLTIVDAVESMEGQGPTNGRLRRPDVLIASTDTVAVDAVCSKIMGFEPLDILTTRIAAQKGLGEADISCIEIAGEPIRVIKDYGHPGAVSSFLNRVPHAFRMLLRPLISLLEVRPSINPKKCAKCRVCVNSCPAKAIDPETFKIDRNKCIMCFCCSELCQYNAVEKKESTLWKLLKKRN